MLPCLLSVSVCTIYPFIIIYYSKFVYKITNRFPISSTFTSLYLTVPFSVCNVYLQRIPNLLWCVFCATNIYFNYLACVFTKPGTTGRHILLMFLCHLLYHSFEMPEVLLLLLLLNITPATATPFVLYFLSPVSLMWLICDVHLL